MILNACNTVMMMLLMIAVGFWAAGKPWFGDQGAGVFSKCLVHISIPCYLVSTLLERISSREQLIQIFFQVPIPAISILLSLGVASIGAFTAYKERPKEYLHKCSRAVQYDHYWLSDRYCTIWRRCGIHWDVLLYGQYIDLLGIRGTTDSTGKDRITVPCR